jgi:hypothetical protein
LFPAEKLDGRDFGAIDMELRLIVRSIELSIPLAPLLQVFQHFAEPLRRTGLCARPLKPAHRAH